MFILLFQLAPSQQLSTVLNIPLTSFPLLSPSPSPLHPFAVMHLKRAAYTQCCSHSSLSSHSTTLSQRPHQPTGGHCWSPRSLVTFTVSFLWVFSVLPYLTSQWFPSSSKVFLLLLLLFWYHILQVFLLPLWPPLLVLWNVGVLGTCS